MTNFKITMKAEKNIAKILGKDCGEKLGTLACVLKLDKMRDGKS